MDKLKKVVEFVKASFADKEARKVLAIVLAVLFLVFIASQSKAKAIAAVTEDGVTITLYDEKCKVPEKATNLPYRATWEDKKGKSEACVGSTAGGQILVFFFAVDNTVVVLPSGVFAPVKGV